MKTLTVHITVPDDRYGELRDLINKFPATASESISFSEASREFGIPISTLTYWTRDRKLLPYSQPQPNGKKFVRRSDLRKLIEIKEEKKAAPRRRKSILSQR
jgi:hypothetical protein